jgi:hypothetical protein
MIPVHFPQANHILAMNQDDYEPLAVYRHEDAHGRVSFCMRLSPLEIEEVSRTRTLWIQQLTFGNSFQPIALSSVRPEEIPGGVETLGLPPHQWRVISEKAALDERAKKLSKFISENNMFPKLARAEQLLLRKQLDVMGQYSSVLRERISCFSEIQQRAATLSAIEDAIDEAAGMPGNVRRPVMQSVRAYLGAIEPYTVYEPEPPLEHPDGRGDTEEEAEIRLKHQLFRKWNTLAERAKRL